MHILLVLRIFLISIVARCVCKCVVCAENINKQTIRACCTVLQHNIIYPKRMLHRHNQLQCLMIRRRFLSVFREGLGRYNRTRHENFPHNHPLPADLLSLVPVRREGIGRGTNPTFHSIRACSGPSSRESYLVPPALVDGREMSGRVRPAFWAWACSR